MKTWRHDPVFHGFTPKLTKSMSIAFSDLKLDELIVIYPGKKSYFLTEKIKVVNLYDYLLDVTKP